MLKKAFGTGLALCAAMVTFTSCENQEFTNEKVDAKRIEVQKLPADLAKVRDYVPLYAVVAHRGSTFWAPEETEAAWRWARNMGADYLESDLQATKDCIVLANHDENLARTTNIENVFSEYVPSTRIDFYRSFKNPDGSQHFSEADIQEQYAQDVANFRPYYALSYYYHELLMLDAGAWFNETSLEQARPGFVNTRLYVSALQDQIAYAEGKKLHRDAQGNRVLTYKIKPQYADMTLAQIRAAMPQAKYMAFVDYDFENAYVADDKDNGNRPGIYIEFKESWLNPSNMEQLVYDVLDGCGWNIITKKEPENVPFYANGKVNIGHTNGKVILQTFSFDALRRANDIFQGRVPMCYLLWAGTYATDMVYTTPTGYADIIKYAQDHGAHIIGPAISGAPNNYPEMNNPWQAYMIRKSGMLNHPYSFDSYAQMGKYMGIYNYGIGTSFDDLMRITVDPTQYTVFTSPVSLPIYMDGFFTNRTEMSLRFMIDQGFRCNSKLPNPFTGGTFDNGQAPSTVPDAEQMLEYLGY
ncbi:MAG: glycerophosphodiester phosphodiesterase [Bacteroides sp.]|nr:glycerophosphodiester phosphodiesterase [Bacteroides sp.]MBD5377868.1 glycerophosphodiester phosphodiesterase [Bacteroides sp.]